MFSHKPVKRVAHPSTWSNPFKPTAIRQLGEEHQVRSAHSKEECEPKNAVSRDSRHLSCSLYLDTAMPEIAKNEAIFPSANEVPRPATILMRTKSFLFCNNGTVNGNEIRRIFEDVQKTNATCKENERLA